MIKILVFYNHKMVKHATFMLPMELLYNVYVHEEGILIDSLHYHYPKIYIFPFYLQSLKLTIYISYH